MLRRRRRHDWSCSVEAFVQVVGFGLVPPANFFFLLAASEFSFPAGLDFLGFSLVLGLDSALCW